MRNAQEMKQGLLQDFGTSKWLKRALQEADDRDMVDMLNDVEILALYLNRRLDEALGRIEEKEQALKKELQLTFEFMGQG
jgi:hypothetical protein